MSAGAVNLQAQVESVLGALVKAATVELTKLFESRYAASALDVDVGRIDGERKNDSLEAPDSISTTDTKRSIGVQVDQDIYSPLELCDAALNSCGDFFVASTRGMFACLDSSPVFSTGPSDLSDGDCLRDRGEEEEEEVKGSLIPLEILLAEENRQVDPEWSPLKEQVVAETVDMVELSGLEAESPAESEPQTEIVLHVSAGTWTDTLKYGSTQSSPTKQKPLVIQPATCDAISEEMVKFVCPLILKSESPTPKPDSSDKPVQAEPQQACVSTAKGTAYSPSPSDGAMTPAQVGVWEQVSTPNETKSNLQMKLKLTSPDQKLTCPCVVPLVNVLTVTESDMRLQDDVAKGHDAKHKTGWPLPKDLRRHQGLHTGHRLCCFTPCGNGVWRLQKVVTHTREGYVCNTCGKTFKRRKILRRHKRFHTGEKPYTCSMCSKTFALRKSLRRHMRFHTGERPHTCTQCSKSFRLRDNLKAHLRFHTGEKPFSCTTCGKMFRIIRNLEKHQCRLFVPSFRTIAGL